MFRSRLSSPLFTSSSSLTPSHRNRMSNLFIIITLVLQCNLFVDSVLAHPMDESLVSAQEVIKDSLGEIPEFAGIEYQKLPVSLAPRIKPEDAEKLKDNRELQLLFLGSGCSSQIPMSDCMAAKPDEICCACRAALADKHSKDRKRNPTALIRAKQIGPDGPLDILIDCGKSIYDSALTFFQDNSIHKLAGVILTHDHLDARGGLDELRGWTSSRLGAKAIQESVSIYCDARTFRAIFRAEPYLMKSEAKTGGGKVAALNWVIIQEGVPFEVAGVHITPLPVIHGRTFDGTAKPNIAMGYLFNRSIGYISDVSAIPDTTWDLMRRQLYPLPTNQLPIMILDALQINSHPSHFGIGQTVHTAKTLGAIRTYVIGFADLVTHASWVNLFEAISRGDTYDEEKFLALEALVQGNTRIMEGRDEHIDWFTHRALRAIAEYKPTEAPTSIKLTHDGDHGASIKPTHDGGRTQTSIKPAYDGLWVHTNGDSVLDTDDGWRPIIQHHPESKTEL